MQPQGLSVEEVLEFERNWWKYASDKDTAVEERFTITAAAYQQRLEEVAASDEAWEKDRILVKRIRRILAYKSRQQSPQP